MHYFKFYVVIHLFLYGNEKYAVKLHKSTFVDVNSLFGIIKNFDCLALKSPILKSGTLSAYICILIDKFHGAVIGQKSRTVVGIL